MIYLDSAATTRLAPEVLIEMEPYLREQYGNAGTLYGLGRQAAQAVQTARSRVASLFSCRPEHILFTSSGSEGNSMVFHGLRRKLLDAGKPHLVVSAIEHDSVLKAAEAMTKDGFYITYVKPQPDGTILPEDVYRAIRSNTGLVSIMYVNNETGAVNDIKAIGQICRDKDVFFHSDCVQAAGQFTIDVEDLCLDFATVSAHKLYGPKGVGALYARELNLEPFIHGGADQESGFRGGTENVPGIVGFGKACELAVQHRPEDIIAVSYYKQLFVKSLLEKLPYAGLKEAGIFCNGHTYLEPGKVLNLRVDGVFGETLVLMMDAAGVCISAGSACCSHESTPSHVLIAMGLSSAEARSSVRISFSRDLSAEGARHAAHIMAGCIETLRESLHEVSPDDCSDI